MEGLNHLLAFLLIGVCQGIIFMQERFQIRVVNEYFGAYKVEQSKQLLQVILQGCAGDK